MDKIEGDHNYFFVNDFPTVFEILKNFGDISPGNFSEISPICRYLSVFLPIFREISPYFITSPAHAQDTRSVQFFFKKT